MRRAEPADRKTHSNVVREFPKSSVDLSDIQAYTQVTINTTMPHHCYHRSFISKEMAIERDENTHTCSSVLFSCVSLY